MKKISKGAIISTTLGVLVLLVGAYCGIAAAFLGLASAAYNAGNYDSAIAHAKRFDAFVPFEKHKGPFDVGTALAAKGDLDGAEQQLKKALELTPVRDECAVRQNLSAVLEEKSNNAWSADQRDEAKKLLQEAKKVSTDAPKDCRIDQQEQNMDQAEKRMDQTEQDRKQQEEDEQKKKSGDDQQKKTGDEDQGQDKNKDGKKKSKKGNTGDQNGKKKSGSDQEKDPNSDGGKDGDNKGSDSDGDNNSSNSDGDQNGKGSGGGQSQGKGAEEGADPKQEELQKRNDRAQQRQNEDSSGGSSWSDRPW